MFKKVFKKTHVDTALKAGFNQSCNCNFQEHQELHQPEDEELPFPFLVKFKPDVGRLVTS